MHTRVRIARAGTAVLFALSLLVGTSACFVPAPGPPAAAGTPAAADALSGVVPLPETVEPNPGRSLSLGPEITVAVRTDRPETAQPVRLLVDGLVEATGAAVSVGTAAADGPPPAGISLRLTGADAALGDEGYRLEVTDRYAALDAPTVAGLHNGVQTVLQLLEGPGDATASGAAGAWTLPGGRIVDRPRYAYRGVMIDIARFWFPVDAIERQIDELAALKFNHLHLHLTDDQGWRIQIDSWPRLATYGGSTQSFGGPAGYLSKDDYRRLVRYAADRGITVVPEIEMPGHSTAALASYPELNCNGVAPPLYTGYEVAFSALCVGRPEVRRFLADVVREVAEMTPGPYLHIGGDEAGILPSEDYRSFVQAAEQEVRGHGKTMIGWAETLAATTPSVSIGQYWFSVPDHAPTTAAVAGGAKLIASPADHAYLDHRYTMEEPEYGQLWAGPVELRNAYEWDPDSTAHGASGRSVLGVEATMFTQFVGEEKTLQYMMFPRVAALAEVAWTGQQRRDWESFRMRMAEQGERWERNGVNFYRSPQVAWAP